MLTILAHFYQKRKKMKTTKEKTVILLELEYVVRFYNYKSQAHESTTKILRLGIFSSEAKAKEFEDSYWVTFGTDPNAKMHYIRLPYNP